MNLVYPACLLAGLAIGVPVTCVLSSWYDRRKTNVVQLPEREPCNVVPLGVRRDNVRVLPQRRWGA